LDILLFFFSESNHVPIFSSFLHNCTDLVFILCSWCIYISKYLLLKLLSLFLVRLSFLYFSINICLGLFSLLLTLFYKRLLFLLVPFSCHCFITGHIYQPITFIMEQEVPYLIINVICWFRQLSFIFFLFSSSSS